MLPAAAEAPPHGHFKWRLRGSEGGPEAATDVVVDIDHNIVQKLPLLGTIGENLGAGSSIDGGAHLRLPRLHRSALPSLAQSTAASGHVAPSAKYHIGRVSCIT